MTTSPEETEIGSEKEIRSMPVYRISATDAMREPTMDSVVAEQAVTILVDQVGSFTLLCTPSDIEAMAAGFLYSEGMIDSADDIVAMSPGAKDPSVIGIRIEDPQQMTSKRNLIVASSCGMCGTRNLHEMMSRITPCTQSMHVSAEFLNDVMDQFQEKQLVFHMTGGSHAAGLFDTDGRIVAFGEDIGRHNALDKAIGQCLLEGKPMAGSGVALSGRVSFEMVAKAARAGIEMIAAVSAPSSFAIEVADRWNITLCGFVRPGRTNVYTHPARILKHAETCRDKGEKIN